MVTLIIVHVAKRLARLGKDVSETWREAQRLRRTRSDRGVATRRDVSWCGWSPPVSAKRSPPGVSRPGIAETGQGPARKELETIRLISMDYSPLAKISARLNLGASCDLINAGEFQRPSA